MLKRIILHLARASGFPEGSSQHGYEIVAPLDSSGHLDTDAWHKDRLSCRARRFWAGEDDRIGVLVHRPGGRSGATWKIDYDGDPDDDESGYRLGEHRFVVDEYVTIRDEDGQSHTFKVIEVKPVAGKRAEGGHTANEAV